MKELYKYLNIMKLKPDQSFALATVIQVKGSAYRHEGAKMLFSENGEQYGMISGGCLEEDLSSYAQEAMTLQKHQTVTYDLRTEDDLGWGKGAGCNGEITVLLEPIKWNDTDHFLSQVLERLERGERLVSISDLSRQKDGVHLFVAEDGEVIGTRLPHFKKVVMPTVNQMFKTELTFEYQHFIELNTTFMFELHEPQDTLYIFGAGTDAEPIVKRAAEFDFLPVVIDPRESRCKRAYFPSASSFIIEHPESSLSKNCLKKNSYVLIMTHQFQQDQQILTYFLEQENRPKYVGILGPKKRTEKLVAPLPLPEWIHSPVGISIHAEGAEEISISILGELIQVRNEKRLLMRKKKKRETVV